jgi:transketolase
MDCEKIKIKSPDRDIFILSKGHNSVALYVTLAHAGFFPQEYLDRFYIDDGLLPGHLDMTKVDGIECSSGSLGHGAGIGLGFAIAKDRHQNGGHVYILLGDGECNEGSVWEAVMFAAKQQLSKLTVIVDRNGLQSYGRDTDVLDMGDLASKFRSFDWEVMDIDGHNYMEIEKTLQIPHEKKPLMVVAHTVKGKGISFMEDKLEWHFLSPKEHDYEEGMKELSNA